MGQLNAPTISSINMSNQVREAADAAQIDDLKILVTCIGDLSINWEEVVAQQSWSCNASATTSFPVSTCSRWSLLDRSWSSTSAMVPRGHSFLLPLFVCPSLCPSVHLFVILSYLLAKSFGLGLKTLAWRPGGLEAWRPGGLNLNFESQFGFPGGCRY